MNTHQNSIDYQGFDLNSIDRGFRITFKKIIDKLYQDGCLGDDTGGSEHFFNLLKHAQRDQGFEQVLKNLLQALKSKRSLRPPALFGQLCQLGVALAAHKHYMGIKYLEHWAGGGFGENQTATAYLVHTAESLMNIDKNLCYHFIINFQRLSRQLNYHEIDAFLDHALTSCRNPKNAIDYLQLKTRSSKEYLRLLARAPKLIDIHERLRQLLRSISGADAGINDLSTLDADELTRRKSHLVTFRNRYYLPGRINRYAEATDNVDFYLFCAVVAGSTYASQSFPCRHGSVGSENLTARLREKNIVDSDQLSRLLYYVEVFRILQGIKGQFPGLQNSFNRHLSHEIKLVHDETQETSLSTMILRELLGHPNTLLREEEKLVKIITHAAGSGSLNDSLKILSEQIDLIDLNPIQINLLQADPQPLTFFPDYFFQTAAHAAHNHNPTGNVDNRTEEKPEPEPENATSENEPPDQNSVEDQTLDLCWPFNADTGGDDAEAEPPETEPITIDYFYDEWNDFDQDYYIDWCRLREIRMEPGDEILELSREHHQDAERIKRMFQRLKPDLIRKEKYLSDGDSINMDRLVDYLSTRKAQVSCREQFYEKHLLKKRDLTVAVLMDMSGSTRDEVSKGQTVIDLEKESSYILAEGLSKIGDRFGIFGFSGFGRDNVEYYIFKDFEDKWDESRKYALLSAVPGNATRMGVHLRHTGWKLSQIPSRKKIIFLISDGKPTDSYYDSAGGYAHYDVRMANLENYGKGIDTFCISTEENLVLELEIMFPFHRYVVIRTMQRLPHVLSRLYLKLTR